MKEGVVYIITNTEGRKHQKIFEDLCNKSIKYTKQHLNLPVAVIACGGKDRIQSDHFIDANPYIEKYTKQNNGQELHGLILAELIKTHICEWSPFDKTLYIDCDAFVMHSSAKDYINVLSMGYELSLATCISMAWKDSIADTSVRPNMFKNIPLCFPYWNFGVFGSSKNSITIMEKIRSEYLKYCFAGWSHFGSCPHAQPAVVQAAYQLSPNHKIFTMPARYNAHFAAAGGYVFSGTPVVMHFWKDVRSLLLRE